MEVSNDFLAYIPWITCYPYECFSPISYPLSKSLNFNLFCLLELTITTRRFSRRWSIRSTTNGSQPHRSIPNGNARHDDGWRCFNGPQCRSYDATTIWSWLRPTSPRYANFFINFLSDTQLITCQIRHILSRVDWCLN